MKFYSSIFFFLFWCSVTQAQTNFEWLVEPTYARAYNFSHGMGRVFQSYQGSGFVNAKGALIVPTKYSVSGIYGDYIFLAAGMRHHGAYSLYNVNFEKVLSDVFTKAFAFSEGMAIVEKDGRTYGMDASGKQLFVIPKEQVGNSYYPFFDGMAVFRNGSLGHDLWGAVDRSGQVVVAPKYRFVSEFNSDRAAFQSGSYWGVLDAQGQVVLAPKYSWINTFSERMAVVRQGNQHGFIDIAGEKVIPIMYKQAHSFSEGLAAVQNDAGLWGFIDKNNHYVLRPQFAQAFSFHEGLARVEDASGKCGFIDKQGALAIPYIFEDARDLSEGIIAVKKAGKWGYIKIINPPEVVQEIVQEVVRQQAPRKLKSGKGIVVSGDKIQLDVFDFEDEDGDSISLFFNDAKVLERYRLVNAPVTLQLELKNDFDNQLVLLAHNLGSKPPNTAAIRIIDSTGKVQQVEMVSDLANSDVLYFFRRQQDVSGEIRYRVQHSENPKIQKEEILFFKGSRLRKNKDDGFVIFDNQLNKSCLCVVEQGQKVTHIQPLNEKVQLQLTDERFRILDYICRKAIVKKDGQEIVVFYTTELPFEYSPFAGIPGVVLQYAEHTPNGLKVVTASKVLFHVNDDELFELDDLD